MTIRAGTVGDIPSVLPMVAKTIAFHDALDPARFGAVPNAGQRYDGWMQRLAGSDTGVFLVADEQGELAGFVLGQVQDDYAMYRLGRYGFIHELWVEEEQRRKGIGKALMLAALSRFRTAGVPQVRLDTAAKNEAAQRLFKACGFRSSTIEMLAEI